MAFPLCLRVVPYVKKMLADAGITREQVLEKRMSLLRRMVSHGVQLLQG